MREVIERHVHVLLFFVVVSHVSPFNVNVGAGAWAENIAVGKRRKLLPLPLAIESEARD